MREVKCKGKVATRNERCGIYCEVDVYIVYNIIDSIVDVEKYQKGHYI